ncbi:MAG: RNA-binding S4 domain-containing protein [Candidatus Latescibacteria bacterium]|jgi:ribosomal 50S subunit-recycling heat shock protein|nr:RNA-binding S4 domain-containing protein [Candidatus Latescibacterota bacterium]
MRIDQYLKLARIIKQRKVAKKACDRGMVSVAGPAVKPSHNVVVGDHVLVEWPHRRIEIEVLDTPHGNVSKVRAKGLYHVLQDVKLTDDALEFESLEST